MNHFFVLQMPHFKTVYDISMQERFERRTLCTIVNSEGNRIYLDFNCHSNAAPEAGQWMGSQIQCPGGQGLGDKKNMRGPKKQRESVERRYHHPGRQPRRAGADDSPGGRGAVGNKGKHRDKQMLTSTHESRFCGGGRGTEAAGTHPTRRPGAGTSLPFLSLPLPLPERFSCRACIGSQLVVVAATH